MLPICWLTQTQFRRILYMHSVIISNINLIGRVFAEQTTYTLNQYNIRLCIVRLWTYTNELNCARVLFSRLCCVGMDIRHFLFMYVQQVSGWCKKERMNVYMAAAKSRYAYTRWVYKYGISNNYLSHIWKSSWFLNEYKHIQHIVLDFF